MKPMSDSHMNVFYRKWWGIHTLWSVQLCGCLMDEQIAHSPRSLFLVAELSAIAGSLKMHFIIEACGERRVKIDFVGRFGPLVWTAQKTDTQVHATKRCLATGAAQNTFFFYRKRKMHLYQESGIWGVSRWEHKLLASTGCDQTVEGVIFRFWFSAEHFRTGV